MMENLDTQSCVMETKECSSLGADQLLDLTIFPAGSSSSKVTSKPGKQLKFDLTTFKEMSAPSADTFAQASGSQGSCSNVVLEAHFKIYFAQAADNAQHFEVKDIVVDTIYGDNVGDYSLRTSVTYLAWDTAKDAPNHLAYKVNAAPGYTKGSPILFAKETTQQVLVNSIPKTISTFEANLFGIPLRGADESG